MSSINENKEPTTTRYQEILQDLRGKIESGELAGGDRLPTFNELRAQIGASQATVERVYSLLEQEGLISRERGRGVFVAERSKRERTGLIGYLGGHFFQRQAVRFSAELVDGIEEVLHREQLRVLLLSQDSSVGWDKVDGILVASHVNTTDRSFFPPGVPVVWLLNSLAGITSVLQDDFGGAQLGIEHLLGLGHRRIGALIQQSDATLRLRLAGYHEALANAGILAQSDWVRTPRTLMPKGGYREWGAGVMREWLEDGWESTGCTALFVQNDLAAIGVLDVLQDACIEVPGDVSLISFDGTDVCDFTKPRLTSVKVPLHEIGVTATEALIEEIKQPGGRARSIVLPASLRPGESTAPPHSQAL